MKRRLGSAFKGGTQTHKELPATIANPIECDKARKEAGAVATVTGYPGSFRKMSTVYSFKEVMEEQRKPLEYKIQKAVEVIRKGFGLSRSAVGIAFSGGKSKRS